MALRLLRPDDAPALGAYFEGLSAATRRVYAPHAFDMETAARICAESDLEQTLRFVAVSAVAAPAAVAIVAYIIVRLTPGPSEVQRYAAAGIDLDPDSTFYLAPSVADDYQSRGAGTSLMEPVLVWLRQLGCQRLVLSGGVRAENARAKRFYTKLGFRRIGDFRTQGDVDNHDMLLDLS